MRRRLSVTSVLFSFRCKALPKREIAWPYELRTRQRFSQSRLAIAHTLFMISHVGNQTRLCAVENVSDKENFVLLRYILRVTI